MAIEETDDIESKPCIDDERPPPDIRQTLLAFALRSAPDVSRQLNSTNFLHNSSFSTQRSPASTFSFRLLQKYLYMRG